MAKPRYHQGFYKLEKPEKYVGDPNSVVYRSGWEKKMFIWCERNPSVIKWGSEIHPIPYWSEVDMKERRYFPDIWLIVRKRDGTEEKIIVEIKPYKETQPPKEPKRKTVKSKAKYLNEALTYQRNKDKWQAAEAFAKKHGMRFLIMTEKELFKNGKSK